MSILTLLFLVLSLGLVGTMWQARVARNEATKALQSAKEAEAARLMAEAERAKAESLVNELLRAQLEEFLVAALGGDKEKALSALEQLREADIQQGDLDLLEAVIAMIDSDLQKTKELASRVLADGCSILGDDCVGAQALIYMADYWSGAVELAEPDSAKLQNAIPTTDIDKLLLAYAMSGFNPYQAKKWLEDIQGNTARTPVGLVIRAQCDRLIALDSRDASQLQDAIQDFGVACYLLNDSELPTMWRLDSIISAIELARQEGRDSDAERHIASISKLIKGMSPDASTAWSRWKYYSLIGDEDRAEQACRDAYFNDACLCAAIICLNKFRGHDALERFDDLTAGKDRSSDWYLLARAHVLSLADDNSNCIRESLYPLLERQAPIIRRNALAALCLVCDSAEIEKLARGSNHSISDEMKKVEDLWLGEYTVSFFAGELSAEGLIELAGDHAFTLTNAGFVIGMKCLAAGEVDEARRYFTLAVEQGGIDSYDYLLAKAYLNRLDLDRDREGGLSK